MVVKYSMHPVVACVGVTSQTPKVFIFSLVIISHYPVSYILGENIPSREYSLSVDTSV